MIPLSEDVWPFPTYVRIVSLAERVTSGDRWPRSGTTRSAASCSPPRATAGPASTDPTEPSRTPKISRCPASTTRGVESAESISPPSMARPCFSAKAAPVSWLGLGLSHRWNVGPGPSQASLPARAALMPRAVYGCLATHQLQVQEILKRDSHVGDLYFSRGTAIQPNLSTASVMMASSASGRLGAMC